MNLSQEELRGNMLYAFFDGDNIGSTLEILLRENRITEASILSDKIKTAFSEIEIKLKAFDDLEILIAAGDDLLIRYTPQPQDEDLLEEIRNIFETKTGLSLSCGIGDTVPLSVQNLYLAKLYGKNRVIGL